jgi:hypothetical protein
MFAGTWNLPVADCPYGMLFRLRYFGYIQYRGFKEKTLFGDKYTDFMDA